MNIVYILATQYDNLGDLIINKELIRALSKQGNVCVDATKVPKEFADELFNELGGNVNRLAGSVRTPSFYWELLAKKQLCDAVIFPPGAQVFGVSRKNFMSWAAQLLCIIVLRTLGVKVCCFGVSFNEDKQSSLALLKWQLFSHIGVRSKKLTEQLRAKLNNVFYCPDLAMLLDRGEDVDRRESWGKYVVVSVRENIPQFSGGNYSKTLKEAIKTIVNQLDQFETVVILAQVERDCAFMTELNDYLLSSNKKTVILPQALNEKEVCGIYSAADYVISNRLHVLLLAIINGAAIVTLTHENHFKLKNVLADLGLLETFIDITSNKLELQSSLDKIILRSEEVVSQFTENKGHVESLIVKDIKQALGK